MTSSNSHGKNNIKLPSKQKAKENYLLKSIIICVALACLALYIGFKIYPSRLGYLVILPTEKSHVYENLFSSFLESDEPVQILTRYYNSFKLESPYDKMSTPQFPPNLSSIPLKAYKRIYVVTPSLNEQDMMLALNDPLMKELLILFQNQQGKIHLSILFLNMNCSSFDHYSQQWWCLQDRQCVASPQYFFRRVASVIGMKVPLNQEITFGFCSNETAFSFFNASLSPQLVSPVECTKIDLAHPILETPLLSPVEVTQEKHQLDLKQLQETINMSPQSYFKQTDLPTDFLFAIMGMHGVGKSTICYWLAHYGGGEPLACKTAASGLGSFTRLYSGSKVGNVTNFDTKGLPSYDLCYIPVIVDIAIGNLLQDCEIDWDNPKSNCFVKDESHTKLHAIAFVFEYMGTEDERVSLQHFYQKLKEEMLIHHVGLVPVMTKLRECPDLSVDSCQQKMERALGLGNNELIVLDRFPNAPPKYDNSLKTIAAIKDTGGIYLHPDRLLRLIEALQRESKVHFNVRNDPSSMSFFWRLIYSPFGG